MDGSCKRRHVVDLLPEDAQRLPARGHNPQSRSSIKESGGQDGDCIEKMFAVVENEKEMPVLDVVRDPLQG